MTPLTSIRESARKMTWIFLVTVVMDFSDVVQGFSDTAVLVTSCDEYSDLWKPCFTFLFKYWPDCPFKIYLTSNFLRYDDVHVTTIQTGKDKSWSSNAAVALRFLRSIHPVLLMWQDDYFLVQLVDTERILKLEDYMRCRGAICLRLVPSPPPDGRPCEDNFEVGEIRKGVPYRVSMQPGFWTVDGLLGLLRWGERECETLGSRRADKIDLPFLTVLHPALTYKNAAVKGRLDPEAIAFCERENVPFDISKRTIHYGQPFPPMSLAEKFRFRLNKYVLMKLWKSP